MKIPEFHGHVHGYGYGYDWKLEAGKAKCKEGHQIGRAGERKRTSELHAVLHNYMSFFIFFKKLKKSCSILYPVKPDWRNLNFVKSFFFSVFLNDF